jgi:hypothetical protein
MTREVLLSSAYFPPAEYFFLMAHSSKVLIEKWENYHKQTYRNRCRILGANGPLTLSVPVLRGSFHKTPIKDLKIDNSRHWRELHLRSITSAYATAPFYEYYFDAISTVIRKPFSFLLDLNAEALSAVTDAIGITTETAFTEEYLPEGTITEDYRYLISPKKLSPAEGYKDMPYMQVFAERFGFVTGLSIIDVLLNNGPGTGALLLGSLALKSEQK